MGKAIKGCESQILWRMCSVVFRAFALKFPIQTLLSVVPKLPVYTCSGEKYENFKKTSTPRGKVSCRFESFTSIPWHRL